MCEWGDTVGVWLKGVNRIAAVDRCLVDLVKTLCNAGFTTIASCCGHGKRPGNIVLKDGREIIICPNWQTARTIDKIFKPIN